MWLITQFRSMSGPRLFFAAPTSLCGDSGVRSTCFEGDELHPDSQINVNSATTQSLTSVRYMSELIFSSPLLRKLGVLKCQLLRCRCNFHTAIQCPPICGSVVCHGPVRAKPLRS